MPHKFFTWLFIAVGTVILLSLGQWQLERLIWKQSILAEIDSKISGLPQRLPFEVLESEHKYMPVQIFGKLKGNYIKVLASQKFIGAGYRIITPLELGNGNIILLDLGFIRHDRGPASFSGCVLICVRT